MSPANIPIWQFKMIIPAAGIMLFVQGLAQICRCILCLKTGRWPDRISDVEETETVLAHQVEDQAHTPFGHSGKDGAGQ